MLRNAFEPWHVIVLLVVVLLIFGGKKLPELARGSGRALRIFKAETQGLMSDDDDESPRSEALDARPQAASEPVQAPTHALSRDHDRAHPKTDD